MTKTTPELASPSPNYYITPMGGRLSSLQINVHRYPTRRVFSGTRLKLMTRRPRVRLLDHYATAATTSVLKLIFWIRSKKRILICICSGVISI
ncbi:hypothetical protein TNCV_1577171 [Trichonephila clavipes]|nr:hypothetical protein TNCV_1577171 [Trichonephila clavipes]